MARLYPQYQQSVIATGTDAGRSSTLRFVRDQETGIGNSASEGLATEVLGPISAGGTPVNLLKVAEKEGFIRP
jgi:hypothetical protein